MKVHNICYDDYANFAYDQTKALQSIGVDAKLYKLKGHRFKYENEGLVVNRWTMGDLIMDADIIQIFHSDPHALKIVQDFKPKGKLTVWHTGTGFRTQPDNVYNMFSQLGCKIHFTDQCEFLMRDRELVYVAAAIDVDKYSMYRSDRRIERPFRAAHYPSEPTIKGSDAINTIMARLCRYHRDKLQYIYSEKLVSNGEQLWRMSESDIYIELLKPLLNGNPYGCYGVTAFEAAALRKVVVTQNIYINAYTKAYDVELPFVIANSEDKFSNEMSNLLFSTPEHIEHLQEKTYKWVTQNHSLEATGNRVAEYLRKL